MVSVSSAVAAIGSLPAPIVLVTEAERTERLLTFLIALLLVVAALLMLLTFWYWRHTDPRRRTGRVRGYAGHVSPEPDYQLNAEPGAYRPDGRVQLDRGYETPSSYR